MWSLVNLWAGSRQSEAPHPLFFIPEMCLSAHRSHTVGTIFKDAVLWEQSWCWETTQMVYVTEPSEGLFLCKLLRCWWAAMETGSSCSHPVSKFPHRTLTPADLEWSAPLLSLFCSPGAGATLYTHYQWNENWPKVHRLQVSSIISKGNHCPLAGPQNKRAWSISGVRWPRWVQPSTVNSQT